MPNRNLLIHLIESENRQNEKYYDFLKEKFDNRFYHYGSHFKSSYEKKSTFKEALYRKIISFLMGLFVFLMKLVKKSKGPTVISTSYFNTDSYFKTTYGFNVSRPPWAYNNNFDNLFDFNLYKKSEKIKNELNNKNFSYLVSDTFINKIKDFEQELKIFFVTNNIVALFVSNDVGFFEKLAISIFKDLGLPSFSFAHGLQFWLNDYDWKRTDYLVVWGMLSKQDFVNMGFNSEKVLVSGHPDHKNIKKKELRFDVNDILVLGNSLNGINPSNEYTLTDRSNCIYYLYLIQNCLKEFNVTKVRFRPHPSENPNWYRNNIDLNFYEIDDLDLSSSLASSSLVIGPTSTVFFDALIQGVNYVVFQPLNQFDFGLNGYRIPSMYNGDNEKVPVAKSVVELREILKKKKLVNISILNDICQEKFDLEDVYSIINSVRTCKYDR